MSILSKVLAGFVFVASLALLYLGIRTLKTHQNWRSGVVAHENAIATVQKNIELVRDGSVEQNVKSILELETQLHAVLFDRGRVWKDCAVQVDRNTGAAKVTIELPDPHEIQDGAILYAFSRISQPAQPGQAFTGSFVGEFRAAQVAGKDVVLVPTLPLKATDPQLQKIAAAGPPWTLYELLPPDRHDIYAGMSDDEIRQYLPRPPQRFQGETDVDFQQRTQQYQERVKQYLKDGKPPEAQDPPELVSVTVRMTKEYSQLDQNARNALDRLQVPREVTVPGQEEAPGQPLKVPVVSLGKVWKFNKTVAEELINLQIAQEVERKYERPLGDYSFYFRELSRQMPILNDRVAAAQKNAAAMDVALKDAMQHVVFMRAEIAELGQEKARLDAEVIAAKSNQTSLEERLARTQQQIDELYAQNKQLATQLAERQTEAIRRADRAAAAARVAVPAN